MKKMRWLIITAALLLMLTGCGNMVQVNPERDADTVIAKVKNEVITKGEVHDQYEIYKLYNGITNEMEKDPRYKDSIDNLKKNIVEMLVQKKVVNIKARELNCYNFTDDQKADIQENLDAMRTQMKEAYKTELKAKEENKDKSDEEISQLVEAGIDDYIINSRYNLDEQKKGLEERLAEERLYDKITDIEQPTEEQVLNDYNTKLKAQEEGFANNTMFYEKMVLDNELVCFVPKNARQTQHILIMINQQDVQAIQQLRQSGDNEGANKKRETALAAIKETADETYSKAKEAEDFKAFMDQFGQDPGMQSNDYYVVLKDTKMFAPEFAEGLFTLKQKGDISEPVATDFGYHIIKYLDDVPAGAVPYDNVKDTILKQMTSDKKATLFQRKIEQWKEELGVKIYMDRLG